MYNFLGLFIIRSKVTVFIDYKNTKYRLEFMSSTLIKLTRSSIIRDDIIQSTISLSNAINCHSKFCMQWYECCIHTVKWYQIINIQIKIMFWGGKKRENFIRLKDDSSGKLNFNAFIYPDDHGLFHSNEAFVQYETMH